MSFPRSGPTITSRGSCFSRSGKRSRRVDNSESAESFRRAASEDGKEPPQSDILLALAAAAKAAGERDVAFKAYLDAILAAPETVDKVLPRVHELLETGAAEALWTLSEWFARLDRELLTPQQQMHVQLLLGRSHLLVGDANSAVAAFDQAMQLAPDLAPTAAESLLSTPVVGPNAEVERPGDLEYALAQINWKLGRVEEALEHVTNALDAGIVGEGEYADADARELEANLLAETGRPEEAAGSFYDAGRRFSWRGEHQRAVHALHRAAELGSDVPAVYWYMADSLRMEASSAEPPFVDEGQLREAVSSWEKGRELGPVTSEFGWAYLVRALMLEALAKFAPPVALHWEALVNTEQALVLDSSSSDSWAFLGRFHRLLEHDAVAMDATAMAVQLDPSSANALMERALILANVGDPATLDTLDLYVAAAGVADAWAEGVRGCVLYLGGRFGEAVDALDRSIELNPNDLWARMLRARVLGLAGERDAGVDDIRWTLEETTPGAPYAPLDRLWYQASAAYELGDYEMSARAFAELIRDPAGDSFDSRISFACCLLALGDLAGAAAEFATGLSRIRNRRQLVDTRIDLSALERRLKDAGATDDAIRTVALWRESLESEAERLEAIAYDRTAATEELRRLRQGDAADDAVARLALDAGLARSAVEAGGWAEAATLYEGIVEREQAADTPTFPEARDALVATLSRNTEQSIAKGDVEEVMRLERRLAELGAVSEYDVLVATAASWAAAGNGDEALEDLHRALDLAETSDERSHAGLTVVDLLIRARSVEEAGAACRQAIAFAAQNDPDYAAPFEARLGLVRAHGHDVSEALEHFRRSMRLRIDADDSNPTRDILWVVASFPEVIDSLERYRAVDEALALISHDEATDDVQRRRLRAARLELSRSGETGDLYRTVLRPSGDIKLDPEIDLPVPQPISLSADVALFPEMEQTPEVVRLIEIDIPAVRRAIKESTGVNIPHVRLTPLDDVTNGRYFLNVNEIPLASGNVDRAEQYCPDADACLEHGITGRLALNPLDGTAGVWLLGASIESASDAGLPLWHAITFMVRHLEAVLRDHLVLFVGVDETQNMLDAWDAEADEASSALLDTVLADGDGRVRVVAVLRRLVSEHVPIRNLGAIIACLADHDPGEDLTAVVERVRTALREELPGRDDSSQLLELPESVEQVLAEAMDEGRSFVHVPEDAYRGLLEAVHTLFSEQPTTHPALVVKDARLRPLVRDLLAGSYRAVPVLAESEVIIPASR
jgi:tetratricopeptide (TPR) repeat protein